MLDRVIFSLSLSLSLSLFWSVSCGRGSVIFVIDEGAEGGVFGAWKETASTVNLIVVQGS